MWFTEPRGGAISRMKLDGTVTHFGRVGVRTRGFDPRSGIVDLAAGADRAIWFSEPTADRIGRMTLGGAITLYATPGGSRPLSIAAAPDGSVWFTEEFRDRIGRLTKDGVVAEYPVTAKQRPSTIFVARDGTVWFNELGRGLGTIAPGGNVTERFWPYGPVILGPGDRPWFFIGDTALGRLTAAGDIVSIPLDRPIVPASMTFDADGNLWFTDSFLVVGKIRPTGAVTLYGVRYSAPTAIVAGGEGNLWFWAAGDRTIVKLMTSGRMRAFRVPDAGPGNSPLVRGADGNVWFAVPSNPAAGRGDDVFSWIDRISPPAG